MENEFIKKAEKCILRQRKIYKSWKKTDRLWESEIRQQNEGMYPSERTGRVAEIIKDEKIEKLA